jgi:hypothetical protein
MPIPATAVLRAGHYVLDADPGRPFFSCDCSGKPMAASLRHIAANRHLYSTWPPAKQPEQTNAAKTD